VRAFVPRRQQKCIEGARRLSGFSFRTGRRSNAKSFSIELAVEEILLD
jgi:hypothetical protein